MARQQHAAIPDVRLVALLAGKMRVNVGASLFGKWPTKGADLQIKPGDPTHGGWRHRRAAYFGFVPVVFLA